VDIIWHILQRYSSISLEGLTEITKNISHAKEAQDMELKPGHP
jgi:hypothetical protein